jgi:AraC family transcriptional regulator, positive regulator of tynA and feaB
MGVRLAAQTQPLARRWSTEEVDARRALAYWVDTVCDRFLEMEIDTPLRDAFRARIDQVELGAITASFLDAETQQIHRTLGKIARTRYPVFMLLQLRAGQARLRQLGHESVLRPGECVLIDGSEPYDFECPQATSALALRLPEDWLKRWLPHPERVPALPFNNAGWGAALRAALTSLDLDSCQQLALPRSVVAEQIAALLALAVGTDSQAPAAHRSLLDDLMGTLRERFQEPNLSPRQVAGEHCICTRSLHYAFAAAGTTFIEQLMRLRLTRAQEILSDPRLAELPVTEVAARAGFLDPSHFARRFRQRFALAPLQYRNEALHRH